MMWKPSRYELCERGPYPSPTEVKAPRDWGSFEFDQPPISEFLEFELVMFGPTEHNGRSVGARLYKRL